MHGECRSVPEDSRALFPATDLEQSHGSPKVLQVRVHIWEHQAEDASGKPTTSPQLAKKKEQSKLNEQENNQHKEHQSLTLTAAHVRHIPTVSTVSISTTKTRRNTSILNSIYVPVNNEAIIRASPALFSFQVYSNIC